MEIDITTLIWTIISFLLFCVILNKLLYKPLVGFMDKRDARIRQADLYVKAEEQKELDQVDVQLPELVCSLAEKILGESIPVSENRDIVDNHAVRS